jgi:hypothetical protein
LAKSQQRIPVAQGAPGTGLRAGVGHHPCEGWRNQVGVTFAKVPWLIRAFHSQFGDHLEVTLVIAGKFEVVHKSRGRNESIWNDQAVTLVVSQHQFVSSGG